MKIDAYVTQPSTQNEEERLKKYVEKLDKKIDAANWKQNLILSYSYLPLGIIKQRLQVQTQALQKKKKQGEKKVMIETSSKKVEEQLTFVKDLSVKLIQQLKDIENQMDIMRMRNRILSAQAQAKKVSLKQIIRENAELTKIVMQEKSLFGERTMKNMERPRVFSSSEGLRKTKSLLKYPYPTSTTEKVSRMSQQLLQKNKYSNAHLCQIYKECVECTIEHMRKMNKSQDIQSGIYLEIMKKKIKVKTGSYSKSKICDVIMDRYQDLRINKPKEQDFVMGLQTFMNLNPKQIMGIILVKDRNGQKLINFLKSI